MNTIIISKNIIRGTPLFYYIYLSAMHLHIYTSQKITVFDF